MEQQRRDYDVIVVGGGHAGVEAAAAACRMGCDVALISYNRANIGALSCNPSIGGVGKGHLIREIDALDGLAGRAADAAAIHYRMLNRSKGAAVHGPRVQVDRLAFARFMAEELGGLDDLTILAGEVVSLGQKAGDIHGVRLADGSHVGGRAVILATGTFLRARMFRGDETEPGGRVGERSATALGAELISIGHTTGRLKTGTPPRLDGRTIDWAKLVWQSSDSDGWTMSPLGSRALPQVACAMTATNPSTHAIIADNLSRSPLMGGAIVGEGPRYCPSIEDKVVRFVDRDAHQIFLEPEALSGSTIYPNGISTSLPIDAQAALLRTIMGLEKTTVIQWGYAVEYDYLDPRGLDHSLQSGAIRGLFCAGQINGTTGYEEAAAQGLVAGCNAAAYALGTAPLRIDRANSYLGVLIDDLVLQGVSEPYRMLTARAEYRLSLRPDNAGERLTAVGVECGCIGAERQAFVESQAEQRSKVKHALQRTFTPSELSKRGASVVQDGLIRSAEEWLKFPTVSTEMLNLVFDDVDAGVVSSALEDARYAPYLARQAGEIATLRADEGITVPTTLDFSLIPGLSSEMVERLTRARPQSISAASRIRGVTPAALTALLLYVRRTS